LVLFLPNGPAIRCQPRQAAPQVTARVDGSGAVNNRQG
jgi:hypothetical protein